MDPTLLGQTLVVRVAFCFVALAIFGLTFHRSFARWAQPILCGTVIVGATGVFVVLYILPEGFTYGTSGVLLVISTRAASCGCCSVPPRSPAPRSSLSAT